MRDFLRLASRFRGRFWRAGLVLLGGWFLLEFALMKLVAARIGWEATLAFLTIKGGIGLILIGFLVWRGMAKIRAGGGIRAGFGVASGILITLPGLALPLFGIALFTPSLQEAILKRLQRKPPTTASKAFDLEKEDWREVRRRKLPGRKSSTGKASPGKKSPKSIA
jgi:UPF0716 family protein affecting phage T7 exclusion